MVVVVVVVMVVFSFGDECYMHYHVLLFILKECVLFQVLGYVFLTF